ncbi:MAG: 16S rRNA (uracil(1498)-N(3))-methyltransferase [Alphaproteobacteria bacterium]|nr:16S rRNA (uracil(1498)-N(3))-methyltransferase [Alphaproteobacteria bacterium]
MKNIPRIFVGDKVNSGDVLPVARDVAHYLTRVMRTRSFLAFGGGNEFAAQLSDDGKTIVIGDKTPHNDPTYDVELYFAAIKRTDDLINMATQMGVRRLHPVITERTVAGHINWERMHKIATEAAEQSNRNSVPEILSPIKFMDLDLSDMYFADERFAYGDVVHENKISPHTTRILVGPEGGFSDSEFAALDAAHAVPVSLGKTILRAEVAAIIALEKIRK